MTDLPEHRLATHFINYINVFLKMEASPGIEPGCKDLQSSA